MNRIRYLRKKKNYFKIINNGTSVKNKNKNKKLDSKVKVIISSWSSNPNKGFDTFKILDENINIKKFEIDFYGNSSIKFNNIKMMGPIDFKDLENQIQNYDLAIIASKNDPCSNFLIECINSDLDILALDSGGHTELISNKKSLFKTNDELLHKISNYEINGYLNSNKFNIDDISSQYINVCKKIMNNKSANRLNLLSFILFLINFSLIKLKYK